MAQPSGWNGWPPRTPPEWQAEQAQGPRLRHRHPAVHQRGFYLYAVEEETPDHSPAAHVQRPRVDYEFHATALDRDELGVLLG
jgi:hypothetical protein